MREAFLMNLVLEAFGSGQRGCLIVEYTVYERIPDMYVLVYLPKICED